MNRIIEKLKTHHPTDSPPNHHDDPSHRFILLDDHRHEHHIAPLPKHISIGSTFHHLVHWLPHHEAAHEGDDVEDKYGLADRCIGKGSFGTVKLIEPSHNDTSLKCTPVYVVKEIKKAHEESKRQYLNRITVEFSCASKLRHTNIVRYVDMLRSGSDSYGVVMEFCEAGDLFTLVDNSGGLAPLEAQCFFKQLVHGVHYLHTHGIVHRDIKPENLLLTTDGCLKISDFGAATAIGDVKGICGSAPYVAPEEFNTTHYDGRAVDLWSCGIVYVVIRQKGLAWHAAQRGDAHYAQYLEFRTWVNLQRQPLEDTLGESTRRVSGMDPFEGMHVDEAVMGYRLLDPEPTARLTIDALLDMPWFQGIYACH